ncbi:hypothetical protein BV898_19747 [Hypsibius exemplaris]|uniref:Uncharacterized protein n=1 Tax=Hypsibius exemplaris TaxID=2072580 RepID=A0A9X6NM05_HYPEX|nr:hypothetical protein BV898_19747 [Hypsibius exemplaris]
MPKKIAVRSQPRPALRLSDWPDFRNKRPRSVNGPIPSVVHLRGRSVRRVTTAPPAGPSRARRSESVPDPRPRRGQIRTRRVPPGRSNSGHVTRVKIRPVPSHPGRSSVPVPPVNPSVRSRSIRPSSRRPPPSSRDGSPPTVRNQSPHLEQPFKIAHLRKRPEENSFQNQATTILFAGGAARK